MITGDGRQTQFAEVFLPEVITAFNTGSRRDTAGHHVGHGSKTQCNLVRCQLRGAHPAYHYSSATESAYLEKVLHSHGSAYAQDLFNGSRLQILKSERLQVGFKTWRLQHIKGHGDSHHQAVG